MTIIRPPGLLAPKSLGSHNPIPRDCVLYLPLWSPGLSGSRFKSVDSYGHPCTAVGCTQVAQGRYFDDDDDYLWLPDDDLFSFIDSAGNDIAFTILAWVNADVATSGMIISKRNDTAVGREWGMGFGAAKKLYLNVHDNSTADRIAALTDDAITENSFQFLAATYDGGGAATGIKLFVNAQQVADTDHSGTYTAVENLVLPVYIGCYLSNNNIVGELGGTIGEVAVYRGLLTLSEIQHYYQVTRGRYQ